MTKYVSTYVPANIFACTFAYICIFRSFPITSSGLFYIFVE